MMVALPNGIPPSNGALAVVADGLMSEVEAGDEPFVVVVSLAVGVEVV